MANFVVRKGSGFSVGRFSLTAMILNAQELTATNIYYPSYSEKYGTTDLAQNGDSVGKIADRKGGYDLSYAGDATPAFLGRPPYLRKTQRDRPYIRSENTPHMAYRTELFPAQVGVPHAVALVMERLPGQEYEAYTPYESSYIGDQGNNIRVGNSDGTRFTVSGTSMALYTRTLLLVEFKQDTMDVYIDGVLKGSVATLIEETNMGSKQRNAVFVDTNNAVWNFYAMYVWTGADYATLAADRTTILQSLNTKWNIGQINPNPYAYDLDYTFDTNARTFTPTCSFANATQEQIDAAEYTWVLRRTTAPGDGGNFSNQSIVSTNKILTEAEYLMHSDRVAITYYVNIPGYDTVQGPIKAVPAA